MKALLFVLAISISSLANASYFATHCSTADGTLRFETGHNSNTIRFENSDNVEIFPFDTVIIKEKKKAMISDVESSTCQMYSVTKKYIQEISISAEGQEESVATFLNENFGGSLETELFCIYHMNSRSGCNPN